MSRFYIKSSGQLRGGLLWPASLLLALSLVLVYAICMVFVKPPASVSSHIAPLSSDDGAAAILSKHSATLAKQTLPSLIRVTTIKRNSVRASDDLSILFGDRLELPSEDLGSGMFVNDTGTALTNYHVVKGADFIEAVDYRGNRQRANLVSFDPLTDLAILQTAFKDTQAVKWGDSHEAGVGSLVWAFGSPFGLENSVTMGILSSNRNPAISSSPFQDFIQTDVATNPGSSGGPLVNVEGLVVGVNTAIAGDKFQGVSFALPSNLAKKVADELMASGHIERGWLGVELSQVDVELAKKKGLPEPRGIYINKILTPGLSEEGLVAGDICLEVEGRTIDDPVLFSRTVASQRIGSEVRMQVLRDGQQIPVKMRVIARPRSDRG